MVSPETNTNKQLQEELQGPQYKINNPTGEKIRNYTVIKEI